MRRDLSAQRLRELLDYDPVTGILTWKVWRGGGSLPAGSVAGAVNRTTSYRMIKIDGCLYAAHRLAWLYVHGEWPPGELDHKDCCRDHNWIDNLRPATRTQNNANSRLRRDSVSGLKGASFHRRTGKWQASIRYAGKCIYLGLFVTAQEAHAAYVIAAERRFSEFARAA